MNADGWSLIAAPTRFRDSEIQFGASHEGLPARAISPGGTGIEVGAAHRRVEVGIGHPEWVSFHTPVGSAEGTPLENRRRAQAGDQWQG